MSTTQVEQTDAVIAHAESEREDGWSRIALDLIESHARDLARKLDAVKAATASLETEVNDSTLVVEALLIMAQALGEIRAIIEEPTS